MERVLQWTVFEKVTIGAALVFLAFSVIGAAIILFTQGLEDLLDIVATLADLLQILLGVPLAILIALLGLRRQRLKAETWIADNAPLLQDWQRLDMDYRGRPKWFRLPLPKWTDFGKTVCPRGELESLRESVEGVPFTMLLAKSGAGKTTLALHLGYLLLTKKGHRARFADSVVHFLETVRRDPALLIQFRRWLRPFSSFIRVLLAEKRSWRFAAYWDMRDNVDPSGTIDGLHHQMSSWSLAGHRMLLILDNVHLAEAIVNRIIKYRGRLFGKSLSCLFVARVTSDSIDEDQKKWDKALGLVEDTNAAQSRISLVRYLHLDREDFGRTVENITRFYATKLGYPLPRSASEPLVLFLALEKKSEESLILLSFVLRELRNKLRDFRKVQEVDVTKAVRKYYDKHVVNAVLDAFGKIVNEAKDSEQVVSSYEHLNRNVKMVLLCVSLYSQLELPTYRPLIFDIIGSGQENTKQVGTILEVLLRNGDLIGGRDQFYHPHITVANILVKAYPEELIALQHQFDRALPPGIKGLDWPRECAAVAAHRKLLDDCDRELAARVLARLLETTRGESAGLLEYVASHELELGLALSRLGYEYWTIGRGDRFLEMLENRDPAILLTVTREAVRNSVNPEWLLRAISGRPELRQNEEVMTAIANAIRGSDEPWEIAWAISRWPEVRQNRNLTAAVTDSIPKIVHAIQSSQSVWRVVLGISEWSELRQRNEIVVALASAIRNSGEPWEMLDCISMWPWLWQNRDVMTAVTGAIPKIIRAIHDPSLSELMIKEVGGWPELRQNEEVTTAIAGAIRGSDEPWYLIEAISYWPELRQNRNLTAAVTDSISKIVHAIQSSQACLVVMPCSSVHDLFDTSQKEEVMTAIAGAIRGSSEPWYLIEAISHWPELRQNRNLTAGVTDSIPKIVHAIQDSREPWSIMMSIRGSPELRQNRDVMTAVAASMPRIVDAICTLVYPWYVIQCVADWPELKQNEGVMTAVIPQVARDISELCEPWELMNILGDWPELRQNADVMAAVTSSIPQISHSIRNSDEPWKIVWAIRNWHELREHSAIISAVKDTLPAMVALVTRRREDWCLSGLVKIDIIRDSPLFQEALKHIGLFEKYYDAGGAVRDEEGNNGRAESAADGSGGGSG